MEFRVKALGIWVSSQPRPKLELCPLLNKAKAVKSIKDKQVSMNIFIQDTITLIRSMP